MKKFIKNPLVISSFLGLILIISISVYFLTRGNDSNDSYQEESLSEIKMDLPSESEEESKEESVVEEQQENTNEEKEEEQKTTSQDNSLSAKKEEETKSETTPKQVESKSTTTTTKNSSKVENNTSTNNSNETKTETTTKEESSTESSNDSSTTETTTLPALCVKLNLDYKTCYYSPSNPDEYVEFSIEEYKTKDAIKVACSKKATKISEERKAANNGNAEIQYGCHDVISYSGDYLGGMFVLLD